MSPFPLIVQQVVAFVALDLLEHALVGNAPLSAAQSGRFWIALVAHAAAGAVVWIVLRLALRVGQGLARLLKTRCALRGSGLVEPAVEAMAARSVVSSCLGPRGPPAMVPAPHLI